MASIKLCRKEGTRGNRLSHANGRTQTRDRRNSVRQDIKSAFNSIERQMVAHILKDLPDIAKWVNRFLEPRRFNISIYNRIIGCTTMTEATPQGSPLRPALLTVYMSHMITQAQEQMDKIREEKNVLRSKGRHDILIPLSFVYDCNSIRVGDKRSMDKCFEKAAEDWGVEWDKEKEWKDAIHLG